MTYGSALYTGNMYRIEKKTWYGRWVLETSIYVEGFKKPEEEFKKWIDRKRCIIHGEIDE
jgi:hypothetical protein